MAATSPAKTAKTQWVLSLGEGENLTKDADYKRKEKR